MPKYTYRCNDCGYEFEKRQRMTEAPLTYCVECAGTVRRVVNSVGVVFKGSGFYVTDNRSKKANGSASGNGATPATTTSSSSDSSKDKDKSSSNATSDNATSHKVASSSQTAGAAASATP